MRDEKKTDIDKSSSDVCSILINNHGISVLLFCVCLILAYAFGPISSAAGTGSAGGAAGTFDSFDPMSAVSYVDAFPSISLYNDKPVITGDFSFPSIHIPGDVSGRFFYSDGYFTAPANIYDLKLSSMSLCFACASMASADDKKITYKNKSKNARQLLDRIGFRDICVNTDFVHKPGEDTIGVVMGRKTIDTPDGEYTLVSVGIRGAGYEREWVGNMKIGGSGDVEGFHKAAIRAKDAVDAYIKRYSIDTERTKFWIAGFSRAGAVTDLLTREITNTYDNSGTRVYGYSFATPRGAYKRSKTYPNSHCVVGMSDAVPFVAPEYMGFTHYGDDHVIGGYVQGFQSYRMVVEMAIDFIITVPKGISFEKTDVIPSQDELIKRLMVAIQYSVAPDRAAYIGKKIEDGQTPQEVFSFLLRFLMTADERLMTDIADAMKGITKNISGNMISKFSLMKEAIKEGIDTLSEEDKNGIYSSLWECIKPALEKTVPASDMQMIKSMWRSFMHILFDLANYDYIHSDEQGFDIIGTLLNNIASIGEAHTPEKYLELVTSQDDYYSGITWEGDTTSAAGKTDTGSGLAGSDTASQRADTNGGEKPELLLRVGDFDKTDIIVSCQSRPIASIHDGMTMGSRDPYVYMGRISDDGSDLKGDTAGVLYLQARSETERALYGDARGTYDVCLIADPPEEGMLFDSWVDEKGVALTHDQNYVIHISDGKADHNTVKPVYREIVIEQSFELPTPKAAIGSPEEEAPENQEETSGGSGAVWIAVGTGVVLAGGGTGGYIYMRRKRNRRRRR